MDNQHRKIAGYRELTQAEIDLMNEIKALGPQLQAVCDKVKAHVDAQHVASSELGEAEQNRLLAANPSMWENWARTGFQVQLMYLTRAVAQPTFF